MSTQILFQDQFEVKDTSKKFDKVTRLQCRLTEEGYDMHLDLDVNTDLWPLELGERFTFALASTLSLDGAPDAGAYDQSNQSSLLDQYEYAMYGKIYKWKQEKPKEAVEVYVSFGGLLMRLRGDARHLRRSPSEKPGPADRQTGHSIMQAAWQKLELDSRIYLLMRKTS